MGSEAALVASEGPEGWSPFTGIDRSGLVGDRELPTALGATGSEDLAAALVEHAATESVLVDALAIVGLECPLHGFSLRSSERIGECTRQNEIRQPLSIQELLPQRHG